jgi:hypothetical protein
MTTAPRAREWGASQRRRVQPRQPDLLGTADIVEALALLDEVGFTEARLTSEVTPQPAKPDDSVFCVLANR